MSALVPDGGASLRGIACDHAYPISEEIPILLEEAARIRGVGDSSGSRKTRDVEAEPALSVIIPALHEADNLRELLPGLVESMQRLQVSFELLAITEPGDTGVAGVMTEYGGRVIEQTEPGYGGALLAGFERASGEYILIMDADLSHPPKFVEDMWAARGEAEVVIASRYTAGGSADMPGSRYFLSRVLNAFFSRGLGLKVRDMSSGYRLIRTDSLRGMSMRARDFDIVQEILVRAYAEGWRVREIPFSYAPRRHGSSHARVLKFGMAYLRTFWNLWKLRNSILAADYDDRAHDSVIFLQRYWQRSRFRYVTELIAGEGPVLDVGCGSSRIIGALPSGSVAVDILLRKLRHARRFGTTLVQASGFNLPFRDESFPCVLCSQVIEHVPKESPILDELCRVLAPGGRLVLGTPDYETWEWPTLEKLYGFFAPGGYADEHISHYSLRELIETFERRGFVHEATRYILHGELILAFRKP
ncbi:MAG TPA: glycosyltransferase [Chloroflexota bacterium]|nr:glycosyltransferase [Chloroflexota bacterium]